MTITGWQHVNVFWLWHEYDRIRAYLNPWKMTSHGSSDCIHSTTMKQTHQWILLGYLFLATHGPPIHIKACLKHHIGVDFMYINKTSLDNSCKKINKWTL
jgi:hypothetical protein